MMKPGVTGEMVTVMDPDLTRHSILFPAISYPDRLGMGTQLGVV